MQLNDFFQHDYIQLQTPLTKVDFQQYYFTFLKRKHFKCPNYISFGFVVVSLLCSVLVICVCNEEINELIRTSGPTVPRNSKNVTYS